VLKVNGVPNVLSVWDGDVRLLGLTYWVSRMAV